MPVLVLRRSMAQLQHCALAIARTLGRLGVPVYAMRRSRGEPSTSSRFITGTLNLSGHGSEEVWIDELMRLDGKLNGAILMPIDDVSAVAVGEHQELLSSRFRFPLQPQGLQRRLASKLMLATVCQELGVPTPETRLVASPEEAHSFAERFGYPVVLKRDETWGRVGDPGRPSVLIVNAARELRHACDRMGMNSRGREPNVLAQECIPGDSESVWMFNGYFDHQSRCLAAFTGQKVRQCLHGAGQTAFGVCRDNEIVSDLALRLMEGVHYQGIVDMGFRFDRRDGAYKLLDVNPRVGSTFRLFSAPDGTDVVRAMYLDLTGRPVPHASALPGRTWLDEPHDVAAALRLLRARKLSLKGWASSTRHASELAWWAKDDPVPFFAMLASLPLELLTYLATGDHRQPAKNAASAPAE